jgi:hypothetical protein
MSKIQSILFERQCFTPKTAKDWLKANNYRSYKLDITKHYIRVRQFDPSSYKHYRIIKFSDSTKALIEF